MLAAAAAVRMLPTLGGATPGGAVDAPPNVTVCDFGSHHRVLPHMAAVIAHGGVSTVTAALAAGVRLICIPRGRAQPLSAGTVEACCAGPAVACDVIAATVDATLRDAPASAAARRFAAAIAAPGAGERQLLVVMPCTGTACRRAAVTASSSSPAMVRVRHRRLCCRVREVVHVVPEANMRCCGGPEPHHLPDSHHPPHSNVGTSPAHVCPHARHSAHDLPSHDTPLTYSSWRHRGHTCPEQTCIHVATTVSVVLRSTVPADAAVMGLPSGCVGRCSVHSDVRAGGVRTALAGMRSRQATGRTPGAEGRTPRSARPRPAQGGVLSIGNGTLALFRHATEILLGPESTYQVPGDNYAGMTGHARRARRWHMQSRCRRCADRVKIGLVKGAASGEPLESRGVARR